MRARAVLLVLLFGALSVVAFGPNPAAARRDVLDGTVEELLVLDVRPFAIGHRGFGENLGEDPSRPIENTVAGVRRAFRAGMSVVEVDVQLTLDRKLALFHEDYLPDRTCINRLTLREVQRRLPHVPTLQAILEEARAVNRGSGPLTGIVIVELKAASPRCDPDDTQDRATVKAVVHAVRRQGMTSQVMLTSFSPALLFHAEATAPEITRILAVSGLQFLSVEEIEKQLGSVTLIDKNPALGLQWAEIGDLFRLPGYRSIEELLATAVLTDARVVEADVFLLRSTGAPLVNALRGTGRKVFGFTANNALEWFLLESLGVDAIYTNDIPLGISLQRTVP